MQNCVIANLENIFIKNRIKLDTILGVNNSGDMWTSLFRKLTLRLR
jgi:hypothetical protein